MVSISSETSYRANTPQTVPNRSLKPTRNRVFSPVWLGVLGLVLLFAAEIIDTTWVCDDAYITYRTIDNLVSGLGLTWNPGYRVQTYTHPLWMLVGAIFYPLSHNAFFTAALLGIVVSLTAVITVTAIARTPCRAIAALIPLVLSKAYIDYSTSGLENPLSHLLIAGFIFVYTKREAQSARTTFLLGLFFSLALLNRLDLGLILGPAFMIHVIKHRTRRHINRAFLGILPLLAWWLFSLAYYGFLFPNTAAAKLNTGIEHLALWYQGVAYCYSTLRIDPITLCAISCGILLPIVHKQSRRFALISAGLGAYILYIISFGGDFMTGRFFSAPLVTAISLLAAVSPTMKKQTAAFVAFGLIILGAYPDRSPIRFPETLDRLRDHDKIEDERAFYMHCASFKALAPDREIPDCLPAQKGRKIRQSDQTLTVKGSVGFFGYFAGPKVHIVDRFALTDPLLARLPMAAYRNWRIGHFRRNIPNGYLKTIQTNEDHFTNPRLGEYYSRLKTVINGPLWERDRWIEIINFNTGQYDALLR